MTQLRQMMLDELQRRNYSKHTAGAYIRALRDFAAFYHQPPDKLGPEQIRQYQLHLMGEKGLAPKSVIQQTWTPTASSKAWNYHGKGILKQWVSRSWIHGGPNHHPNPQPMDLG
jgi:hypothetical protein